MTFERMRVGPFGLALAVTVLAVSGYEFASRFVSGADALEELERKSLDARFTLRGPMPVRNRIVVVALDDESRRRGGLRLQRRGGFGELVKQIRAAGARVIGIDAFFPDEEHVLPPSLAEEIRAHLARPLDEKSDPVARALLERVFAEEQGDEKLRDAIKGDDVVLAVHVGERSGFTAFRDDLAKAAYGQAVPGRSMPFAASRILASLPMYQEAAARVGTVTIIADAADQTARSIHAGRTFQQRIMVPFAVQIAAAALQVPRARLAYDAASHVLHLGDRTFETTPDHALLLNHRGGEEAIPVLSAADVLEGKANDALRDAVVIVGYTELGQDTVRTPFTPQLSGAALHAQLVSNLIDGDPIRRTSHLVEVLLRLLAGACGAVLFWGRLPVGALPRVVLVVVAAGVWLLGAQAAFEQARLWIPVVGPLAALSLASLTGLSAAYGAEGMLRARLRRSFAQYLSNDVIEELLRNPASLALGGERRELTVLFSDIRGFTTLSEQLEPLELVRFLNRYFTPMTRAVLEHRGLLDKYIGDAVMAVFGAPVARAMHADDGLACALAMFARLEQLRDELRREGHDLQIGIGLNTGEMVVGNMGSAERFDYTVIGDAVNAASRIEGLTRPYGVFCLAGENTRKKASARFRFRELDLVRVKGKDHALAVFELLGDDARSIASYVALGAWDAGLAAYRAGRFDEARVALARFAAANPHDQAASVLLQRMSHLGVAPAGWTGVFDHVSK